MSAKARKARTKRLRRTEKQKLKFGPSAKSSHTLPAGRTGSQRPGRGTKP